MLNAMLAALMKRCPEVTERKSEMFQSQFEVRCCSEC